MPVLTPANDAAFRSRALVLGPRAVALWIAADLAELGFQPQLAEDLGWVLPSLADPNAQGLLREMLQRFVGEGGLPAACVHPGVSFWGERPELSVIAQELGLAVLSPPVAPLTLFGNKLALVAAAESIGVPALVAHPDPISSPRELESLILSQRRALPVILKSVHGGGGSGVLVVHELEDLHSRVPLWLEQLRQNYGEAIFFAERYLEGARHIVLPFARSKGGAFQSFALVDASLQCRHRKVIEFCPAPAIDHPVREKLVSYARSIASQTGFIGVGTLEFLVDSSRVFFIDGSARLDTSFRLWERVSGTKAVHWQMRMLTDTGSAADAGEKRENAWTSAVALRIYAEDSVLQLPQPGTVAEVSSHRHWELPGAQAELYLGVDAGKAVSPEADGLVGIAVVGAEERNRALSVAQGILDELWIAGSLQTNERFLSELLSHPWVREGVFHAGFVDEEFVPELRPDPKTQELLAALAAEAAGDRGQKLRWAVGDRWVKSEPSAIAWVQGPHRWVSQDEAGAALHGARGSVRVPDGRELRVLAYPLSNRRWQVRAGKWVSLVRAVPRAKPAENSRMKTYKLLSLVPGQVHSLLIRESGSVAAHEPLAVVKSLGILVPHAVPLSVSSIHWKVRSGDSVTAGQELAELQLF